MRRGSHGSTPFRNAIGTVFAALLVLATFKQQLRPGVEKDQVGQAIGPVAERVALGHHTAHRSRGYRPPESIDVEGSEVTTDLLGRLSRAPDEQGAHRSHH